MHPTIRHARRNPVKGLVSGVAMALSLAGGAVLATAAVAPAAMAQDYSRDFVKVYQPVADVVNAEGGDIASVAGQFPAIIAAARTADDKHAAGNLILVAGTKTSNKAWQRQGLETMLASGKVAPERVGQLNWFVGNLAFEANDFAASRAALIAAQQAGYTENDPSALIAETYFRGDDVAGGIDYLVAQANQQAAAGRPVGEEALLIGLQAAYDARLAPQAVTISKALIQHHATPKNWTHALQVVGAVSDLGDAQTLDLLRLMRLTNAIADRSEYIRYVETADPRIMSNEVVDVLAEAVAAGKIATSDTYYQEVKSIIDQRMAGDRRDAPAAVRQAESGTGRDAMNAGDVLYSLDDFAGAERMYALAVERGGTGVDADTALTRLGITQARQGKHAEAKASFARVGGKAAVVAAMWSAYVDTQAG